MADNTDNALTAAAQGEVRSAIARLCQGVGYLDDNAYDLIRKLAAAIRATPESDDDDDEDGCPGHESLDGAHMGESVYCDGTCQTRRLSHPQTSMT